MRDLLPVGRKELRPYQEDAIAETIAAMHSFDPLCVVPTGGGKSLIIAEMLRSFVDDYGGRIMVLTHVKELVEQNYLEFCEHWNGGNWSLDVPAGIYAAGLNRRDSNASIVFASIQSVWNKPELFGHRDALLVDEAHLVPKRGSGRYRTFLESMRETNPSCRLVGMTATPYRLDGGWLHKGQGALFGGIAYEVPIEFLIAEGYLCDVIAKRPEHTIDTSDVRSTAHEFNQRDLEEQALANVKLAVDETVRIARADDRRSWLIFASGVRHAGMIAEHLREHDVTFLEVYGNTPKSERARAVESFRDGGVTALINVGVLTTGFNAPRCDLLSIMRPTQSASLYVQMIGRGMRTFDGKPNCLVLDYGDNIMRHGPINKIRPTEPSDDDDDVPPVKVCPVCSRILGIAENPCPECGHAWESVERNPRHHSEASDLDPIEKGPPPSIVFDVDGVHYAMHRKPGRPPSLRVSYTCGLRTVSEWVCLEHEGFAKRKAKRWWSARALTDAPVPETIDRALELTGSLLVPKQIVVVRDGRYFRVQKHVFA